MTDNDLAATVAALKDGDRVRATFVSESDVTIVYEAAIRVDSEGTRIPWHAALRFPDGTLPSNLTAVEVLDPALPPEPPVGSGVFHDGVLWFHEYDAGDGWLGPDQVPTMRYASWADIQPCVPAVPQPTITLPGKAREWA